MIFTLWKRTVRIIAGVKCRNSCRNLFMRSEILPIPCGYIFTLMTFAVNIQEHFQTNSAVHSVNTRNRDHLTDQLPTFHVFKEVQIMLASKSSTVYHQIWEVLCIKKKAHFKVALKRYLNTPFTLLRNSWCLKWIIICAKVFFPTVCFMDLV
jgi:hypothetical protein